MTGATARVVLERLWAALHCPASALDRVTLTGAAPALPSSFRVTEAAQATVAASALAASEVGRLRGGPAQAVSVDARHAAIEFRSERYFTVDGKRPDSHWDRIAGIYPTGDGRWVRLHTNFPHHREGVLKLLGCDYDRDAVARALMGWEAENLEDRATEAGLVVAMMRSFAEWDTHPQGKALAARPVMSVEKIGDGPPVPLPQLPKADARPLSGLRVLDLTRVIAGPLCGRTLAAHGAEVLRVTGPHLPSMGPLVIDMGRGKRSAHLDLREEGARGTLRGLLAAADVFVQGYRPGAIAGHGFSPEQAAAQRPGLICVSLSAYGDAGPWADKRGFDSLVQMTTGIDHAEAEATGEDRPRELPCQALDHASGYLMAFGALAALARRAKEGGSWHVTVSLARTGHWLRGLGRDANGFGCADPTLEDVADLLEESPSGYGRLSAVRHAGILSHSPPRWDLPSMPLGSHAAAWA